MAWAIYGVAWSFIAALGLFDWLWAQRTGFAIDPHSFHAVRLILAILLVSVALFQCVTFIPRYRNAVRKLFYREVSAVLLWLMLVVVAMNVLAVLQYLCVATDFPLIDDRLLSWDAAIGYHWLPAYRWVVAHPSIQQALWSAYSLAGLQLMFIPLVLAVSRKTGDYAEFVVLFLISAIVILYIATLFPAESAFVHFGIVGPHAVQTVADFDLLRAGRLHTLDIMATQGLVSFPSFHTILAVFFAYSVRHVRYVFPLAMVFNAAVIVSTPTQGGHYLVDVIAGLVVAGVLIVAVRRLLRIHVRDVGEPSPLARGFR